MISRILLSKMKLKKNYYAYSLVKSRERKNEMLLASRVEQAQVRNPFRQWIGKKYKTKCLF